MTTIGGTPYISRDNTTNTALEADAVWTGSWEKAWQFETVMVALKSDVAGTLTIQFSPDMVNIDSALNYDVAAATNELHRLSVSRAFCRMKYTNGSVAQDYFRLQTIFSHTTALTSPLNSTIQTDADATIVRAVDTEFDIAAGRMQGSFIVNKFGRNPAVSTGDVPEDIWAGGGVYTGFPAGAAEKITVASSSTDDAAAGIGARTVRIYGQLSGVEQTEDIILNGTTLVDSVASWTRVYRATVLTSGGSPTNSAFNAGTITVAHKVTTANIFAVVPIAANQSQVACYTIPLGKVGYLRYLAIEVERTNTAIVTGAIWVRENGAAPRLTRIFYVNNTTDHTDSIYGGLEYPALTDIAIRITSCSANNVPIIATFDLIVMDA